MFLALQGIQYALVELLVFLILALLLGLVIGWFLWKRGRVSTSRLHAEHSELQTRYHTLQSDHRAMMLANVAAASTVPAVPVKADDLLDIDGIGPVIKARLADIGVTTFKHVATLDGASLEAVRKELPEFSDRIEREEWITQARRMHAEKYNEHIS